MKIQKQILAFSIIIVASICLMIDTSSGEEFPWPMFLSSIFGVCENDSNEASNGAVLQVKFSGRKNTNRKGWQKYLDEWSEYYHNERMYQEQMR